MKKWVQKSLVFLVLIGPTVNGQILSKSFYDLDNPSAIISGNGIADIRYNNDHLWIGTGSGLSRTQDGGTNWFNIKEVEGIGKGSISAIAFKGNTIWIATSFDTLTDDAGLLSAGGGLSYSDDNGLTWTYFPQPGLTNVQNITFDISFVDSTIWITSFGGGLKRSDNWGQSWRDAPPDSFFFDPLANLNHRAFSTISADGILWVGTAGGINRSLDNGESWVNFNHQNQEYPISGNFVVALAFQKWRDRNILWAATREAEERDEFRAVSYSEDFGFTWKTTLPGVFAHNFAFDDSTVYVATDRGLFKSIDFGLTWASFQNIVDANSGELLLAEDIFSAGVSPGQILWLGSEGGLAKTDDDGDTWTLFRSFETLLNEENVSETYAYPNPYSPLRNNQFNGEGHVRFHYRVKKSGMVSVSVYDFAMVLVKNVEEGVSRMGDAEFDAVWDGRNNFGERVANGVYFYRVDLPGDNPVWGKVIVID